MGLTVNSVKGAQGKLREGAQGKLREESRLKNKASTRFLVARGSPEWHTGRFLHHPAAGAKVKPSSPAEVIFRRIIGALQNIVTAFAVAPVSLRAAQGRLSGVFRR
jgi:hypothetical protein